MEATSVGGGRSIPFHMKIQFMRFIAFLLITSLMTNPLSATTISLSSVINKPFLPDVRVNTSFQQQALSGFPEVAYARTKFNENKHPEGWVRREEGELSRTLRLRPAALPGLPPLISPFIEEFGRQWLFHQSFISPTFFLLMNIVFIVWHLKHLKDEKLPWTFENIFNICFIPIMVTVFSYATLTLGTPTNWILGSDAGHANTLVHFVLNAITQLPGAQLKAGSLFGKRKKSQSKVFDIPLQIEPAKPESPTFTEAGLENLNSTQLQVLLNEYVNDERQIRSADVTRGIIPTLINPKELAQNKEFTIQLCDQIVDRLNNLQPTSALSLIRSAFITQLQTLPFETTKQIWEKLHKIDIPSRANGGYVYQYLYYALHVRDVNVDWFIEQLRGRDSASLCWHIQHRMHTFGADETTLKLWNYFLSLNDPEGILFRTFLQIPPLH